LFTAYASFAVCQNTGKWSLLNWQASHFNPSLSQVDLRRFTDDFKSKKISVLSVVWHGRFTQWSVVETLGTVNARGMT
jgi:hypothetical protein